MEVSTSSNRTYQNDAHEYVIAKCVSTRSPHMKTLIWKWHRKWKYLEKKATTFISVCLRGNNIKFWNWFAISCNRCCQTSHVLHRLFSSFFFFHFYFLFLNRNRRRANMSWSNFFHMCVCVLCTLCRFHRQDFPFQFPMSEGLQIKCTRLCIASITIWIPDYPVSVHQCSEHWTWERSLHPTTYTHTDTNKHSENVISRWEFKASIIPFIY